MDRPPHISQPRTTQRIVELLDGAGGLDWSEARVADVGAGAGYFTYVLGERLRGRGLVVGEHVFPCDRAPEEFAYGGASCAAVGTDGRLPFADGVFDAAVSIEVIEHVEDQFAFVRELVRIVKPGGRVYVTTPNVLNLQSRLRTLACGFPELFDPLPLDGSDARYLGGHVHPISPYFLAYVALRCGLEGLEFHFDRTKRSAAAWAVLLSPLLLVGAWRHRRRLRRKQQHVLEQNEAILSAVHGWGLWTSRTTILVGRKPGTKQGGSVS